MEELDTVLIEVCSRAAHEVNRAYSRALGDASHVGWDEAPDEQKRSTRNGVIAILQSDQTPEQSHATWMAVKLADGWHHGPVKDSTKKEHPCIIDYKSLPVEQRVKDEIFVQTVKMLASVMWRIPQ